MQPGTQLELNETSNASKAVIEAWLRLKAGIALTKPPPTYIVPLLSKPTALATWS